MHGEVHGSLSGGELLKLWETGAHQHPLDRALTILAAVEPATSWEELAGLPCGRRDERLLVAYEANFGSAVEAQGECPECVGRVEFSLNVRDILSTSVGRDWSAASYVTSGSHIVTYRLPNSFDLAAIVEMTEIGEARLLLLERCLLSVTHEGVEVPVDLVPEGVIAQIVEQMATDDPLAEIDLALSCPACGTGWQLFFDIGSFMWCKVEAQTKRLLREIHILAAAYGWPEEDILRMAPARRQAYLEMVTR